ncbi:MAG: hypothetical protein JSS82_19995 [Bacteroidetes bacterium]|nr:hypothetical protein [Bacteroidota bacterium]
MHYLVEQLKERFELEVVGKEDANDRSFGNWFVTLVGGYILIRYVQDRSIISIEVASKQDPKEWFEVSLVKDYILGEADRPGIEKLEVLQEFLANNFERVQSIFAPDSYGQTKAAISRTRNERFKRMFPGWA